MNVLIPVPADFSFFETLHSHGWRHLQPFSWEEETQTLHRVERLSDGRVVQISLAAASDAAVRVTSSEPAEEADVLRRVRRMLQLDQPIDLFHAFCASRPELCHIPARRQGRMLRSPTLWEDAVKVICTTNTTWAQTKAMVARLCAHFGSPGPESADRHAFPTPAQVAEVPLEVFAAHAKLGYRNAYVHAIATRLAEGSLEMEAWQDDAQDAGDLRKRLLGLPGVGPYGAACLMLYLGRPGPVNADSWARTLVARELGRPVSDKEVHAFFEGYGEWRGLVYTFYPWKREGAG